MLSDALVTALWTYFKEGKAQDQKFPSKRAIFAAYDATFDQLSDAYSLADVEMPKELFKNLSVLFKQRVNAAKKWPAKFKAERSLESSGSLEFPEFSEFPESSDSSDSSESSESLESPQPSESSD